MTTTRDNQLITIAREALGLETLDTRRSDSLDFHDLAVWCVKDALQRAYEAGRQSARPTNAVCPACGRKVEITPLPAGK
ncbi:MAG: hypothetical protein KJZ69_09420 [Phycisphaerales bacterium]|nr:hypothetical protein [Phycisphaerales bacterium]